MAICPTCETRWRTAYEIVWYARPVRSKRLVRDPITLLDTLHRSRAGTERQIAECVELIDETRAAIHAIDSALSARRFA